MLLQILSFIKTEIFGVKSSYKYSIFIWYRSTIIEFASLVGSKVRMHEIQTGIVSDATQIKFTIVCIINKT